MFSEIAMYEDHLQRSKKGNANEEYIDLNEIIEELGEANENAQQQQQEPQTPLRPLRKSTRVSRPLEKFIPTCNYAFLTDFGEQETYEEAMQVDSKKKWDQEMKEEMDSLAQNQTWNLLYLPTGKNALQNKWVYR